MVAQIAINTLGSAQFPGRELYRRKNRSAARRDPGTAAAMGAGRRVAVSPEGSAVPAPGAAGRMAASGAVSGVRITHRSVAPPP